MAIKRITENPTITDQVLLEINIVDSDGEFLDPDTIDKVVIYFIERSYSSKNEKLVKLNLNDIPVYSYYKEALPLGSYGTDDVPVWDSSDEESSILTHEDTGQFILYWTTTGTEGDYFVTWSWTIDDVEYGNNYDFYLASDPYSTNLSLHLAEPTKYEELLENYMPEFTETQWTDGDVTPEVILKYNQANAKHFTMLENMFLQIYGLQDANVMNASRLTNLADLFNVKLRSQDATLWRRQLKTAVPTFKKKGTYQGLKDALANAGIELTNLSNLWQVVSKSVWNDGFLVKTDGEDTFQLTKVPLIADLPDTTNFKLWIKYEGDDTYTLISDLSKYEFVVNENSYVEWNSTALNAGDYVLVRYKFASIANQTNENYLQSLPLADTRDEVETTYPLKNWNLKLIEMEDSFFSSLCSSLHPFQKPTVFGEIRTEFPFSENVFNMDTYNGSLRDSTEPCDIDKNFLETCSCCQSSRFNVDVEISSLSDDRINEAEQIINEYRPFHMIPNLINYNGMVDELYVEPTEDLEILIQMKVEDNVIITQDDFNRTMVLPEGMGIAENDVLYRGDLASYETVKEDTGTGTNNHIVLFSPAINLKKIGLNYENSFLEILSGANEGEYTVYETDGMAGITQASPDSITEPANSAQFSFRLSYQIYEQNDASIYQDLANFTDPGKNFYDFVSAADGLKTVLTSDEPWKVHVGSGPAAGTYYVYDINANGSLVLVGYTAGVQTSVSYALQNHGGGSAYISAGNFTASMNYGRIALDSGSVSDFGIKAGQWLIYDGDYYQITKLYGNDSFFVSDYSSGNVVGSASILVYNRVLESNIGFLAYKGMTLECADDHEAEFGVVNGTSDIPDGSPDIDSNFKENYIVRIGDNDYKILEWDGTEMTLSGSPLTWKLTGTSVDYEIIQFTKTETTIGDKTFLKIDRGSQDSYTIIVEETEMGMLSLANEDSFSETQTRSEVIELTIKYKNPNE